MPVSLSTLIHNTQLALRRGEAEAILPELEKAVVQHKGYADLHHLHGMAQHQVGNFNEAIKAFQQALKINPNYLEARLNLAILYNDLGEYAKARKLCAALPDVQKKNAQRFRRDPILDGRLANQHAASGDIYARLGRFVEAIDEYRKALNLGPHFADIRTRLGIALREHGKNKDALKEFQQALKDNPHYVEAQLQLGLSHFAQQDLKAAKAAWQAALKRDPKQAQAKMYLQLAEKPASPAQKKPRKK